MTRLLLIEDSPTNQEIISRYLQVMGYHVLIAPDGAEGVALAVTERPDLILMDLSLPGIDGLEATRRIKAQPETSAIPIVALTAHALVEDQERALAAGCDAFETKPIDFPRLIAKMDGLLHQTSSATASRYA